MVIGYNKKPLLISEYNIYAALTDSRHKLMEME